MPLVSLRLIMEKGAVFRVPEIFTFVDKIDGQVLIEAAAFKSKQFVHILSRHQTYLLLKGKLSYPKIKQEDFTIFLDSVFSIFLLICFFSF